MRKKIFSITLFIQIICFIVVLGSFIKGEIVQARNPFQEATPQPFLGAIYYGRRTVTNVFDHSFPGDKVKNNYVIHYDGTQHKLATNTPTAPEISPTPGEWIRNGYGYNGHLGIDYNLMYRPVLAAAAGTVEVADWSDPANHRLGYGLHAVMSHFDNPDYQTRYGHLSSLTVQTGDEIKIEDWDDPADRRRILGISGNTGNVIGLNDDGCPNVEDEHSCGFHLHFEVRLEGVVVNPYGWIAVGVDGTPTPDPWAPPDGSGAISYPLWSTRPAISTRPATSSSQYPDGFILTEPDTPLPYITVDNADEDHYSQTPNDCMIEETGGHNGTFHRVQVINDNEGTPTCTVRWTITPPNGTTPNDDGYYELYVYIPETTLTLSRGAVYNIWHVSEDDELQQRQAIAVQAVFPNVDYEGNDNWVYLGRYHFTLDGTEYVELNNVTFDGDDGAFFVAADAIQLSVETLPPTNTPTPTPPPTDTPVPPDTPVPDTPTPDSTPTSLPPSDTYMTKVSTGSGGQNPAISSTGQYLAYYTNDGDIIRYDRYDDEPYEQVATNSYGNSIAISDDGNYIAYTAYGSEFSDIFLYDRTTGLTQNLTNHPADSDIYHIKNSDIKIVPSGGSVLVGYTTVIHYYDDPAAYDIWLYDHNLAPNAPTLINPPIDGPRYLSDISADGDEVLIRGNRALYVYNRATLDLETIPLLHVPDGIQGADFSSNGRYLVYDFYVRICDPYCSYEVRIYWYDRAEGDRQEIYFGFPSGMMDAHSRVSDDGNYVFFTTTTNESNIYRYEHDTGDVNQITLTEDGSGYPNGYVREIEVSGDGRFVAFESYASNLVVNDTNGEVDVFLADTDLLSGPPVPTATPGDPNPTPKPKTTCVARAVLASNDLGNSRIVVQHEAVDDIAVQSSGNESLFKRGRQFLGKMQQTADMLTLLYRLRDDVMSQTEIGLYYTDLYYAHTEELTDIIEADSVLFQETHDTMLLFEPHLTDFLDGDGNNVTVTAAEVQAAQSLLDQFAAAGSPALQQAIAAEQARVPLAQFVGKTSNEVWDSLPPPPEPAIDVKINYQPASAAMPAGYLVDDGSVFGDRGNGYTYGWDSDITITSRDRDNSNSPDQRYDTLVHSQHTNLSSDAIWEIDLPNGEYEVYLVAGDPSYYNGYYHILVEGISIIDASPSSGTRWFEGTANVVVSDGRLSLTNGSSAQNNKFDFVHVRSLGTVPTATATSLATATVTSTPLPTAANTSTNTPTPTATPIDTPTSTPTNTPTAMPSATSTPTPMATVTPVGTASAPIHINFQSASVPIPVDYLVDKGVVFSDRGNGFTYGWDIGVTNTTRDRNNSSSPDQRYDTLVHSQHPSLPGDAIWEIALPNGEYEIHFVAGDPSYFDSYYHILAEGITLIDAAPSSANRWLENSITITVSDGRLSLTNGANADNNKFAFIDIIPR